MEPRVPLKFGISIPRDLLVENVHWLKELKNINVCTLVRDNDLINVTPENYTPAKNIDVLNTVSGFSKNIISRPIRVSDQGLQISLIDERFPRLEPRVGDITRTGLNITNSETGGAGLKAAFLLFRLYCRNGATIADRFGAVR